MLRLGSSDLRGRPESEDHSAGAALDRALREEIERTRIELAQSEGRITADEASRLAALIALKEANGSGGNHTAKPRLPAVIVVVLTVGLVGALLFGRVDETRIELVAIASGLAFTSAANQPLTELVRAHAVGVTGVASLRWPAPGDSPSKTETFPATGGGAVKVTANQTEGGQGSVSLAAVMLSPGVHTAVTFSSDVLRLELDGATSPIDLSVAGDVAIVWAGSPPRRIDTPSPEVVSITPVEGPTTVVLEPEANTQIVMSRRLSVSGLSFREVEEVESQNVTVVREVSTIASGTLYLTELGDLAHPLRAGAALRLDLVEGEIAALTLSEEGISLRFGGVVRDLRIGDGAGARNLMPNLLDWLKAHHALSLFWGTSLYLIGLALGLLRWMRA